MSIDSEPTADFNAFYRQHLPQVRRIAARWITDEGHREEAVQDAFTRAYVVLASGRRPPMSRVTRNACIDVLRSHRLRQERVVPVDPHNAAAGAPAVDDVDAQLASSQRKDAIAEALSSVDTRQREVLVLHEVDGLPYELIAASTGASLDSLRSLAKRGKARFRETYSALADARGLWGAGAAFRRRGWRRERHEIQPHSIAQRMDVATAVLRAHLQFACGVLVALFPPSGPTIAEHAVNPPAQASTRTVASDERIATAIPATHASSPATVQSLRLPQRDPHPGARRPSQDPHPGATFRVGAEGREEDWDRPGPWTLTVSVPLAGRERRLRVDTNIPCGDRSGVSPTAPQQAACGTLTDH